MSRGDRNEAAIKRIVREGNLDGGLSVKFVVGDFGQDAKRLARGTGSHARNVAARAAMRIGSSRPVNGDPDTPPPAKPKGRRLSGKGNDRADTSFGEPDNTKTDSRKQGFGEAVKRGLFGKKPTMDYDEQLRREAGL